MNEIKPFDIVEIVGNYGAYKHPVTAEEMKKGHLALVLSVDGDVLMIRPFGYPYTTQVYSNEVKLKHSMGLEGEDVLTAALGTNSYLIHAFSTNDTTCTTIAHNVDRLKIIGVCSVTLDTTKDEVMQTFITTPSEG